MATALQALLSLGRSRPRPVARHTQSVVFSIGPTSLASLAAALRTSELHQYLARFVPSRSTRVDVPVKNE